MEITQPQMKANWMEIIRYNLPPKLYREYLRWQTLNQLNFNLLKKCLLSRKSARYLSNAPCWRFLLVSLSF